MVDDEQQAVNEGTGTYRDQRFSSTNRLNCLLPRENDGRSLARQVEARNASEVEA